MNIFEFLDQASFFEWIGLFILVAIFLGGIADIIRALKGN